MLGHQFAYSAAPIRKVKEVKFGLLSPKEICACHLFTSSVAHSYLFLCHRKPSVPKIKAMDEATHKPKMAGLMDPRMGTIDRNFKCQTCGEGTSECPGHFGHIEVASPFFHPGMSSLCATSHIPHMHQALSLK